VPPAPQAPTGDYFVTRLHQLSADLHEYESSPRAAAILYRLEGLVPDLPSLTPLADVFETTARNPRAVPEVRRLAEFLLAGLQIPLGKPELARQSYEKMGFAFDGWLVGGFDNEGGSGHATDFPPEHGIDLTATYPGKERTIGWHLVPPVGPTALIPVSDLLRPTKNATFYFLTNLEVAKDGPAVFHFGTSGATRLFVNGQPIAEDPDDHPARFDQRSASATVHAGTNTVLLKVSTLDERPGFFLRVSGPGDAALAGARFVAPPAGARLAACDSASKIPDSSRVSDVRAALQQAADDHPKDGLLLQDYATVLDARRPYDTKQQLARRKQERVVELLPNDARAQAVLARYIDDDANLRREALEKSLEADPKFAPARAMLAGYYAERGFGRRAYDEASRAAADSPDYFPAQIAVAEALQSLGLEARGQRMLLDLGRAHPSTPALQIQAARVERSLGRLGEAMNGFRHVLDLRYDDREARAELAALNGDAGDVDGTLAMLHRAVDLAPTSIGASLRLADFLSFNGRPGEALAMYDQLSRTSPDDDSVFEARGQHLLRQNDAAGALRDFERALALKPQNPHLRDLIHSVQPQEDYATPYLRDAVALARAAPAKPPDGDDASLVLAQVNVVRVFPNGLASRVQQMVVKVFNDQGVNETRVQGINYVAGDQEIKVEHARIIRKDGTVVEAKGENDVQAGDAYGGMYFDHRRQKQITYPNLQPGDTIELTYRRDDISSENMFADYFGDVSGLQGGEPVADVDYVLIAPAERVFYSNTPALKQLQHTVEKTADGQQVQRWRASNVPRVEPEPKMPGWTNVAAYLHVSTFKDWADMGRYWWGLVHDQLTVTPAVAAAADEAVKNIPADDVPARVRAIYDTVVTTTHYVGLEFGIHGFKPYPVDQILSRRYGDCKDKASLMYAMLNHLGIKANLVLLRMRSLGHLDTQPASLAAFNHAILYVPALNRFLDGTAEFSGFSELPDADQGAQALIVKDDGTPSTFLTTPMSASDENLVDTDYDLKLAPDGSATIQGAAKVVGNNAQGWRRNYLSESGRREKFEQAYAQRYPGVKATAFDIADPSAIEKPVQTKFTLAVPQLAQKDGDALVFSPFGEPWRYLEGNAPQSKRTYPVDMGTPWGTEFRYTIHVPPGYALVEQPTKVEKTSPFGHYRFELKPTADGLAVSGQVSFSVQEVPASDYAAFRAFLEELDRTFSRRLRVAPAAVARAEATP
jgi:tetratricopeptide (TPR) repeat protein